MSYINEAMKNLNDALRSVGVSTNTTEKNQWFLSLYYEHSGVKIAYVDQDNGLVFKENIPWYAPIIRAHAALYYFNPQSRCNI